MKYIMASGISIPCLSKGDRGHASRRWRGGGERAGGTVADAELVPGGGPDESESEEPEVVEAEPLEEKPDDWKKV